MSSGSDACAASVMDTTPATALIMSNAPVIHLIKRPWPVVSPPHRAGESSFIHSDIRFRASRFGSCAERRHLRRGPHTLVRRACILRCCANARDVSPATHLMISTHFGDLIAERMRAEHRALAARWFERLLHLLPEDARDIFPTESLLEHIPALILEISAYLQHPEEDAIASNTAIIEKAQELGGLRHA